MWFPRNKEPRKTVLWPIAFASKILTITESHYSNIYREALDILRCLEKIHHYHFTCKVSIITDHKQLVAIAPKNIASLSQRLQTYYYTSISTE